MVNKYFAHIFLRHIFIQQTIQLSDNIQFIKAEWGFTCYDSAAYMKRYAEKISGKEFRLNIDQVSDLYSKNDHVCVVEIGNIVASDIGTAKKVALEKAKLLIDFLRWNQDENAEMFGIIVSGIGVEGSTVEVLPQIFVMQKTFLAEDLQKYSQYANQIAQKDQKFAMYLSLYSDALKEDNLDFKIVKLWSVLETMAYPFKQKGDKKEERVNKLLSKYELYIEKFEDNDLITLAYKHRNSMVHEGTANPAFVSQDYKKWVEITAPIITAIVEHLQNLVNLLIHRYLVTLEPQ